MDRLILVLVVLPLGLVTSFAAPTVEVLRTPNGGIQPRVAMADDGCLHVVYFSGKAAGGNVYYTYRAPGESKFQKSIRVNRQNGSAVAAGTIRGPQMALGRDGRVHVAWMGSRKVRGGEGIQAEQFPMWYTRLTDDGESFEPERNLLTWTGGLDGGGLVAADDEGNVYVAWHGRGAENPEGEEGRAVYVTHSRDDGGNFSRETLANRRPTGACGCCGLRAFSDQRKQLYLLYRSAGGENRNMALLSSADRGQTFQLKEINQWRIDACPMSSAAFASAGSELMVATERSGQIEIQIMNADLGGAEQFLGTGGGERKGKHPSLARNENGDTLLVWSEGAGWRTGGGLRWQLYSAGHQLKSASDGETLLIPDWSFASAVCQLDGGFLVIY